MVETVILAPVFFALVFLVVFIGFAYGGRRSLTGAITNGTRLAFTRGNVQLVAGGAGGTQITGSIPSINNWISSGCGTAGFPPELRGGPNMTDSDAWNYYTAEIGNSFGTDIVTFCNPLFPASSLVPMPVQTKQRYFYSMAFTYRLLSESTGQLKYPCQPGSACPCEGSGCVSCHVLHAEHYNNNPGAPNRGQPGTVPVMTTYPVNQVVLQCEYSPGGVFFDSVNGLLRIMGSPSGASFLNITRVSKFPMNSN